MTNERMKHLGYGLLTATLVLLSAAGCKKDHFTSDEERGSRDFKFSPEDENRPEQQIMASQAATAAREDAQLSAQHFNGAKLNSLGTKKLDLMLRASDSGWPMAVYINVAPDDFTKARQDAVTDYLKSKGLSNEQIALKDGPNMDSHSPAAYHMSRMSKTESGGATAEGGASANGTEAK